MAVGVARVMLPMERNTVHMDVEDLKGISIHLVLDMGKLMDKAVVGARIALSMDYKLTDKESLQSSHQSSVTHTSPAEARCKTNLSSTNQSHNRPHSKPSVAKPTNHTLANTSNTKTTSSTSLSSEVNGLTRKS